MVDDKKKNKDTNDDNCIVLRFLFATFTMKLCNSNQDFVLILDQRTKYAGLP